MHSILRQQAAQFVAVGGCGCLLTHNCIFTMNSIISQCIRTNSPPSHQKSAMLSL